MTEAIPYVDKLIKEYLVFRGLFKVYDLFETETKSEKFKGFHVRHIRVQLFSYVNSLDHVSLMSYWKSLDDILFSNLGESHTEAINTLGLSLKRFFLVTAIAKGHPEKVKEFYDRYDLGGDRIWKKWFALPYVKHPEEDSTFALYFTRKWKDHFSLSLNNFLVFAFSNIPLPRILLFNEDRLLRQKQLREIEELQRQVSVLRTQKELLEKKARNQEKARIKAVADGKIHGSDSGWQSNMSNALSSRNNRIGISLKSSESRFKDHDRRELSNLGGGAEMEMKENPNL